MPTAPRHRCSYPGCKELLPRNVNRCQQHPRHDTDNRASAAERGYDSRWQKIRILQLRAHPLCHDCLTTNRTTAATEVHHIKALKYGGTHADSNLMSLCKQCHQRRTNRGE